MADGRHRMPPPGPPEGDGVEIKAPPQPAARKDDHGKPRPSLAPPGELMELFGLFAFGATKYSPDNWRMGDGIAWSRFYDAMNRHSLAFWGGEDFDPESGYPHVICVAFSALILAHYMKHFPEQDDRWKGRQP